MVPTCAAGLPPRSASKASSHEKSFSSGKVDRSKTNGGSSDEDDNDSDESSSSDDDEDDAESVSGNEGGDEIEKTDDKEDVPAPRAPYVPPPTAASGPIDEDSPLGILRSMVEVAQICHFLHVFGRILKIPGISRMVSGELETALVEGESCESYPLLIEVYYRLCRDAGQKIEKARLSQEWERVLHRKLVDTWQREFTTHPMMGAFQDVPVRDKALILHYLCEWRLQSCAEIKKHIAAITTPSKDNKDVDKQIASLRPEALGQDDKGSIYWYFDDGCWVYAEDKPSWQAAGDAKAPYHVRYATPTKIRLSAHYGIENNDGMDSIKPTVVDDKRKLKRKRSSSSKKESKKESSKSSKKDRSKHKRKDEEDEEDDVEASPPPPPSEVTEPPPPPPADSPPAPESSPPEDDIQDKNVLCCACNKFYDISLLDPPLPKKPQGDWTCFECLVNNARGWPRRRPSRQSAPPPLVDKPSSSKKESSKKESSSSKKEKKSKKTSSKKSSSKKSSSKKSSSSSKKKSKRHSYPEEYKYLLDIYTTRKRQREQAQVDGMASGVPEAPTGPTAWRVVSASVADLKQVLERDFAIEGSMKQQRLKGRLIQILKAGEAAAEEQLRLRLQEEQQMMWQMQALPRRESSRKALERLKHQSDPHHSTSKSDDETWEDKSANDRAARLSRRASSETNGLSAAEIEEHNKRRMAMERAHRASRRQRDMDGQSSDEEETPRQTRQAAAATQVNEWVNWKAVHSNAYPLRTVCSALVGRVIQEEMAALFSRPVNPVADGCPDYLAIVKQPMDLGTVKVRSLNGHYTSWDAFKQDLALVWSNCRLYNSEGALIVTYANVLEKLSNRMIGQAEQQGVDDMKEDEKEIQESEEEYNKSSASSSSDSSADDSSSSSSSDSDAPPSRSRPPPRAKQHTKATTKPPPKKKRKPSNKVADSSSDEAESDVSLPKRKTPVKSRAKTIASSSDSSDSEANVPLTKKPKSPSPPPPPMTPPPPIPVVDPPSDSSSSSSYFSSSSDSE
ncbi:Aste57867_20609 [Aphanomyces stellatus]|uniref:Aste57867_20609 protein n=1 Tax=Aphanomyces stellatus TaxID=120398 RepID=A0A485LFB5_9STRA|nr:hypothetical protein As57867_020541 [Aphanomyces stellatus]VFT97289.1 Aste57867_20609 [Aphanomyces stellatus]